MKMENEILAPKDGTVATIAAPAGATVMKGDLILEIVGPEIA
jgi:biotin carboxyl carrier protein